MTRLFPFPESILVRNEGIIESQEIREIEQKEINEIDRLMKENQVHYKTEYSAPTFPNFKIIRETIKRILSNDVFQTMRNEPYDSKKAPSIVQETSGKIISILKDTLSIDCKYTVQTIIANKIGVEDCDIGIATYSDKKRDKVLTIKKDMKSFSLMIIIFLSLC